MVTIFTNNGCPQCVFVKNMAEKTNIETEIINLSESPEYIEKYQLTTVPTILVDGEIITDIVKIREYFSTGG